MYFYAGTALCHPSPFLSFLFVRGWLSVRQQHSHVLWKHFVYRLLKSLHQSCFHFPYTFVKSTSAKMKDKSRKTYRPDGASFEGESLLQTISFSPDSTGSFSQSYKCERFKDVHELQATHLPSVLPSGLYTGLAVLEPIKRPTIAEEHMFPYVDAMPCHKCEAITVEALLSPGGYRHGSLAVISVSAGYGCKICRLMVQEIDIRDLNRQEFLYEPIVLRLANSTGTAYCQDEVWIKVGGKGTAIMGLYTDDGKLSIRILC